MSVFFICRHGFDKATMLDSDNRSANPASIVVRDISISFMSIWKLPARPVANVFVDPFAAVGTVDR